MHHHNTGPQAANVLTCLPLLADILGKSYGVTVTIGGSDAYTDGKTITLPSLPMSDDPDFLGLVRGFIDHESAHIRHTDFEAISAEKPTPLEKTIWNTLEDWRVETELGRLFPGCAGNFRWLIGHLFMGRGKNQSLFPVLDWLLLTVRNWSAPELMPDCDLLAAQVEGNTPGLIGKLMPLLDEVKRNSPDSGACLDHARKIVRLLEKTAEEIRHNKQKGEKQPETIDQTSVGNGSGGSGSSLKELLRASEQKLGDDLGTILKDRLKESIRAMPSNVPRIRMATEEVPTPLLIDAAFRQKTKATAIGLRARLHGLIQATKLVRRAPSRRGKLDCHRLYGVAVNDPRLFRQSQPKPAINTAVHLLLDASGSMCRRMELAGQCCLALAQALEQSGVSVGMTAFRGGDETGKLHGDPLVIPLLRHGERAESMSALETPVGSTPLAEALWWVLPRLASCRKTRRIIIVVTDGLSDSPLMTEKAVAALEKIGLEVYALGIRAPGIEALFPHKSANAATLREIPQATFGLVDKALFKGARTR